MKKNKDVRDFLLWTLIAILGGILIGMIVLPLVGVNPFSALQIMISGTFADAFTMGNILVKTAPLIITALAFAFTYKANLYNIGAQGQFYVGCIAASAISIKLGGILPGFLVIILAMLGAIVAGGLIGFIIGFLKAKFNANEFLVSMMSTYVITYFMQLLLRTSLQESKHEYLKTDYLDSKTWLPNFIPGTNVSIGIIISVVTAILVYLLLYKTSLGYKIRVTGLNADASGMSGMNPKKTYIIAFLISGAIAGLAGFIEINGMQHMLLTNFDTDIGSYGIGIAILSNSNPIGIIFGALLFGFLQVGGTVLSHTSNAPASVIDLIQGLVMLFVLVSFFIRERISIKRLIKNKMKEEVL